MMMMMREGKRRVFVFLCFCGDYWILGFDAKWEI